MEPGGSTWAEARWLQVTFEVPREAALAWLPSEATRPVPPYARIIVVQSTGAPGAGAGLAALLVGGRLRARPVNSLAAAVGDDAWGEGQGTQTGISLVVDADRALATVMTAGVPLIQVRTGPLAPVDPRLLHWDPWLVSANDQGGDERLVELKTHADIRAAWRSKTARVELGTHIAEGSPWRELRNINTISAIYCEGSFRIGSVLATDAGVAIER